MHASHGQAGKFVSLEQRGKASSIEQQQASAHHLCERPIWQRQYFPVCTVESLLASGPHRTSRTSIIAGKWFKELAAGWLRILDSIRVQARDLVNVHRAVLCSNSASLQLCRTGICRPALLLSVIPLLCIM